MFLMTRADVNSVEWKRVWMFRLGIILVDFGICNSGVILIVISRKGWLNFINITLSLFTITIQQYFSVNSNHYNQQPETDNNDNDDFEELMNFRRQKFNRYDGGSGGAPQRLSCVNEQKGGISESLASLIADGFEIGWLWVWIGLHICWSSSQGRIQGLAR